MEMSDMQGLLADKIERLEREQGENFLTRLARASIKDNPSEFMLGFASGILDSLEYIYTVFDEVEFVL